MFFGTAGQRHREATLSVYEFYIRYCGLGLDSGEQQYLLMVSIDYVEEAHH